MEKKDEIFNIEKREETFVLEKEVILDDDVREVFKLKVSLDYLNHKVKILPFYSSDKERFIFQGEINNPCWIAVGELISFAAKFAWEKMEGNKISELPF